MRMTRMKEPIMCKVKRRNSYTTASSHGSAYGKGGIWTTPKVNELPLICVARREEVEYTRHHKMYPRVPRERRACVRR